MNTRTLPFVLAAGMSICVPMTARADCDTGDVSGACISGQNSAAGIPNFGVFGADTSNDLYYGTAGVGGYSTGSLGVVGIGLNTGSIPVLGTNTDDVGVEGTSYYGNGVFGASSTTLTTYSFDGGEGEWAYGVGTQPSGVIGGVVGSGTGEGVYGVYGTAGAGTGVYGVSSSGLAGVWGQGPLNGVVGVGSGAAGATGVRGASDNSGIGVYGVTDGGNGDATGAYGVYGSSAGSDAIHGEYNGSGTYAGVTGIGDTTGYGVFGSSSSGYGVYAVSDSANAIEGYLSSGDGQSAIAGINVAAGNGVYGRISGSSGTAYAVWGRDLATGGTHYAAEFSGNVNLDYGCVKYNGVSTGVGTCSSDRRLKKNIQPLAGSLEKLVALRPSTYEWRDTSEGVHASETGPQMGFIAQDVEPVFPKWVGEDKHGFKTLSITPREFQALAVDAIQTLKKDNDELRAEVKAERDARQADHDKLDRLENGKDPMTGDRGMLWMVAMFVAVGGGVIVTRKQQNEKRS